jgi:hypothetical protein
VLAFAQDCKLSRLVAITFSIKFLDSILLKTSVPTIAGALHESRAENESCVVSYALVAGMEYCRRDETK